MNQLRCEILLAFQVATLGMIGSTLRSIAVKWDESSIDSFFLFHGEIGSEEIECVSDVQAEILAAFPNFKINAIAKHFDYPENMSAYE